MNNFYTDEKQITSWLDKYEVKNYTLISDEKYGFVINVDGDIYLRGKKLKFIPVKFNEIRGDFNCSDNELNNLEFCPNLVGKSFYCDSNKLTSLKFSPNTVVNNFYCNNNQLESLDLSPTYVGGIFICNNNKLNSLEFCPGYVGGDFYCYDNPGLKEIQEIVDFKQIYLEHKKFLIERFSGKLDASLDDFEESKKTTKIKL